MNDHELTKQRQEHFAKHGIQKGFPVHVLIIPGIEDGVKVFFTKDRLDYFVNTLNIIGIQYKYKLVHVDDVTNVSYKTLPKEDN